MWPLRANRPCLAQAASAEPRRIAATKSPSVYRFSFRADHVAGESLTTRREVDCFVHSAADWLHELTVTQFNLTDSRRPVQVPPISGLLLDYTLSGSNADRLLVSGRFRESTSPRPNPARRTFR
jgi:hypothetical protein